MVQINVDTDKDSPEMIVKIIEMLSHHIRQNTQSQVISTPTQSNSYNYSQQASSVPVQSKPIDMFAPNSKPISQPTQQASDPFSMFNNSSSSNSTQSYTSNSLPSSAPVKAEPTSMFDMFASEPNQVKAPQSVPSQTSATSSAGYANDDLFSAFSNDTPSTTPSYDNAFAPRSDSADAAFQSAQSLLNEDFTVFDNQEPEDLEPKKSANFFSFEQY